MQEPEKPEVTESDAPVPEVGEPPAETQPEVSEPPAENVPEPVETPTE